MSDRIEKEFSYKELHEIVSGYSNNNISDDEMSDWIGIIFERGMSENESANYTKAVINSGARLDFSSLDSPVVDKHSTGGVGDKVSIVLGPLLAAYGYHVPMIVGRSLGHTGGTLDKLCSIPGYKPHLDIDSFKNNVKNIGISIMGQTEDICPADKKIYALRDRINRIASNPLICGSIMSKKIAEGIKGLVLDIKTGNGAFMYKHEMALELGNLLSSIGERNGLKVKVAITDMNQPLGESSGIACEIIEGMEALKGNGPQDLMNIVYYLAEELISMFEDNVDKNKLHQIIESGGAYQKFVDMVEAHGGSILKFNQMNYSNPKYKTIMRSNLDGYVKSFKTKRIGEILSSLGLGTHKNTDEIDNFSGLRVYKKISEKVSKGEPILEFYCSSMEKINNLEVLTDKLFNISIDRCKAPQLIY